MVRPQRLSRLQSAVFSAMDEAKRRRLAAGGDVINLSVGSPDLPPAPHVRAALHAGIDQLDNYGYPLRDLATFREAIAGWYERRFAVTLDPETQVLGLTGSQEGLAHFALAYTDPGDVILVPDPGYPIYAAGPTLAGATVYPYPLLAEADYRPDLAAIPPEIRRRAKVLLLNYPSNPLAAVAAPGIFAEVVAWAHQHGIVIIHDAAYSELAFDGYKPPSFLETPGAMEVGIEFNSCSKTFNMAGCRIAYALGNADILGALAEVKSHLDYGLFRPLQQAAIAALTGPQDGVAEMAMHYQRRRDVLVEGLQRAGWPVAKPKATMFVWAPTPGGQDDVAYAMHLAEETGVIVVPGSGFGERGRGYIRIALVQPEAALTEAAARMARFS